MQNNNGVLSVKGSLTRLGRLRYNQDRFNVTKFALSDDGVNYRDIASNLIDDNIVVKRNNLFSIWKDGASTMKSKLIVNSIDSLDARTLLSINRNPLNWNFNLSHANVEGSNTGANNPFDVSISNRNKIITYNFSDSLLSSQSRTDRFMIDYNMLPFIVNDDFKFITVTLHDTTYLNLTLGAAQIFNDRGGVYEAIRLKNNKEAFDKDSTSQDIEKIVNLGLVGGNAQFRFVGIHFNLHYRGNFVYERPNIKKYETLLTITAEETGHTENIRIILQNN